MSVRRATPTVMPRNGSPTYAAVVKESIKRDPAAVILPPGMLEPNVEEQNAIEFNMDDLTSREQAVASLGVNPSELVGMGWLNERHHEQLVKNNSISDTLARRLEAYKQTASS